MIFSKTNGDFSAVDFVGNDSVSLQVIEKFQTGNCEMINAMAGTHHTKPCSSNDGVTKCVHLSRDAHQNHWRSLETHNH